MTLVISLLSDVNLIVCALASLRRKSSILCGPPHKHERRGWRISVLVGVSWDSVIVVNLTIELLRVELVVTGARNKRFSTTE